MLDDPTDPRLFLAEHQRLLRSRLGLPPLLDATPGDLADDAQRATERVYAEVTRDRLRIELHAVTLALQRVIEGRYGVCEGCEHPIPLARLQALPAAACCVPCQEALEQQARRDEAMAEEETA